MNNPKKRIGLDQPGFYEIQIQGRLSEALANWFEEVGFCVSCGEEEPATTTLTGTLTDQAALHGLLNRISNLGLPILMVKRIEH